MLGEAGYAYRKVLQILRCHPEVPWLRAEVAISQAEEGSGWEDPARHAPRNGSRKSSLPPFLVLKKESM
jgi:hypothetical protein